MSRIILASGSPRRRELLTKAGIEFTVQVSHEEERYTKSHPAEIVMELAEQKARHIAGLQTALKEDTVVIGADTVVAVDENILGKPEDAAEAAAMIRSFQGREHQVYTGVCLIRLVPDENGRFLKETTIRIFHACSNVYVQPLSEEEIRAYVDLGESMDAAGAYKIQGAFGKYITHIEGDLNNIIGLPADDVVRELNILTGGAL